ncbi:MAG TPA: MarR family transcriptional regulator [Magnetospirillum sp.]|nr:MarR family transcriptional regulator [Magnetospirillum sp.]
MTRDRVDHILEQWRREMPELDCSVMEIPGRMKRLTGHLEREIQRPFTGLGLPPGGFDVLATLRRCGPPYRLSPNDLLAWMMVTSGTMTNRVDQLERLGLVAREPNPDDRRSVLVALTPQGHAVVDKALRLHVDNERRLLSPLSPEQRAQLADLLRLWLAAFEP